MIRFDKLTKSLPGKELLKDIALFIKPGMRIGLVGVNGSGKTTLLRLILGEDQPDQGRILIDKNISLGYLPQEIIIGSDNTILDEVIKQFPEVGKLENKIRILNSKIAKDPHNINLSSELGNLHERYEQAGGWSIEQNAKKYLAGIGFSPDQFEKPLNTFSGGWRMRVVLAGILLKKPDILLLDEPTNHLDLEATIWLEDFLQRWKGCMVIISHDREFLNRAVGYIYRLHNGQGMLYKGNYSDFQRQRALQTEQQGAAYDNQQRKIAEIKRFIERFRYKDSKARQVQSRVKMLEKMERIAKPDEKQSQIRLNIPQPSRGPQHVIELINAAKSYPDVSVYTDLNMQIERSQKIGLVGENGAGKSTLLKMLAGIEQLSGGKRILGNEIAIGYFAQHQTEILKPRDTIFHTVESVAQGWTIGQIRNYLGSFLFTGDDIEKQVQVLSGGEKSRLVLAKLLIKPVHLLLLDEPTNHLDILSRNVVETAMEDYKGALVCISHDRHFLNKITNTTYEIGNGVAVEYFGNYDYYIWKKESPIDKNDQTNKIKQTATKSKFNYKEQKRTANRIKTLKRKIEEMDRNLEKLKIDMLNPSIVSDYEKIQKLNMEEKRIEESYFILLAELERLQSG